MNQNVRNMFQKNFVPNSRIVFSVPVGQTPRKGSAGVDQGGHVGAI